MYYETETNTLWYDLLVINNNYWDKEKTERERLTQPKDLYVVNINI